MDAQPSAPPVVAVVVTCDPGTWLEGCLASLATQDYPNLAVLVVDAGSAVDPTPRVAAVMPSAYVRRVAEWRGFPAGANEAIGVVEGASHLLFCHDDVSLAPDAVRLLVEEAFRSNAGVVTPKLVESDAPDRLLAVGVTADKGGVPVPLVERGELDQEQHDVVRDVFAAPPGCVLVRADLFEALGGFDEVMAVAGAELDFSWRAHIVGARVVVAPQAMTRHLEATRSGLRATEGAANGEREAAADIASLRAALKNYSRVHLLRVLPQLVCITLLEIIVAVAGGHPRRARPLVRPWQVNLGAHSGIRRARQAVRKSRTVPDREVRDLQASGSARLRALFRGVGGSALRTGTVGLATAWRRGLRETVTVWVGIVAMLMFGTRQLLGSHLPLIGEFVPFPSPATLWANALSGWRLTGMGSASPAPSAFALLGAAGDIALGDVTFLQRFLVLGMIPLGVLGAFRLARPLGSRGARLVATVFYVANPLPYNALAGGHWDGLIAYAVTPWLLILLAGATGLDPFGATSAIVEAVEADGDAVVAAVRPGAGPSNVSRAGLLGLLLAAAGALVPALLPLTLIVAVTLVLGSLLAGGVRASLRAVFVGVGGMALAALLLFPWALGLIGPAGGIASSLRATVGPGHQPAFAQLLRFQTGPTGAGPLGWALLAAAVLPLVIGARWRHAWAVRFWVLAFVGWALAWVAGRGWLPFALPPAEVLLAPAVAAMAMCTGLGLAAFVIDLRGYHFGWRQVTSFVAAGAAFLAVLPVLGASFEGRWHTPAQGFDQVLSWMPDRRVDGDFRVLWMGDPAVLPIAAWRLGPGLGYATSRNGLPDVVTSWPGTSHGATSVMAHQLTLADRNQTTQLGHLLAPMAVRYLVIVQRSAPLTQPGIARPAPTPLVDGLRSQVDLRRIDSDGALVVYENAAWAPARSIIPPAAVAASESSDPAAARTVDLSAAPPVLRSERGPTSFAGSLTGTGQVLLSEAPSDHWQLRVKGVKASRRVAFGTANAFVPAGTGPATVSYHTPLIRVLVVGVQAALWLLVAVSLWTIRRRRGRRQRAGAPASAVEPKPAIAEPLKVGA